MLFESQEAVIKVFGNYSSIASEVKYKTIHENRTPIMSARAAQGRVAKVSNRKVSDQISKY